MSSLSFTFKPIKRTNILTTLYNRRTNQCASDIERAIIFHKELIEKKEYEKLEQATFDYIMSDELGWIIFLSGKIGAGKSILMAGLAQLYAEKLKIDAEKAMKKSINILNKLDFNVIDDLVLDGYSRKIGYEKLFLEIIAKEEYKHLVDGEYDSLTTKYCHADLLYIYVRAKYCMKEEQFIMSNNKIYSRMNSKKGEYSKPFSYDFFKLTNKIKPLRHFIIYCLDEATALNPNFLTDAELKKSGLATILRLFRTGFEQLAYHIKNAQNYLREAKLLREISNSNIYINGFTIKEFFPEKKKALKQELDNLYQMLEIEHPDPVKREIFMKAPNTYRDSIKKINEELDKLFALSTIIFDVKINKAVRDDKADGKGATVTTEELENSEDEEEYNLKEQFIRQQKLHIPVWMCFGAIDTFNYKRLIKDLIKFSDLDWNTLDDSQVAGINDEIKAIFDKYLGDSESDTNVNQKSKSNSELKADLKEKESEINSMALATMSKEDAKVYYSLKDQERRDFFKIVREKYLKSLESSDIQNNSANEVELPVG